MCHGSLASVIGRPEGTHKPFDLQVFGLGAYDFPPRLYSMLVCSVSVDKVTGESITVQVIKPDMLFWCVIAMTSPAVFLPFYKMTTERIRLDETQEKTDIAKTLKAY